MQVAAINAATERVWLTTAYFVPSEAALMSLTLAALRGVDVRLLVPLRSDSLVVTAAARSYFDELIDAGRQGLGIRGPHAALEDAGGGRQTIPFDRHGQFRQPQLPAEFRGDAR